MTRALDTGHIYSEARLTCLELDDDDGRETVITQRNLGWHAKWQGYVSEFIVAGVSHYAFFKSAKHRDEVCPDPMLRLSSDKEFLEDHLGLLLLDGEPVADKKELLGS